MSELRHEYSEDDALFNHGILRMRWDGLRHEDELKHYGVKGMRWGVRKDGKPQGFQYGNERKKSKPHSQPTPLVGGGGASSSVYDEDTDWEKMAEDFPDSIMDGIESGVISDEQKVELNRITSNKGANPSAIELQRVLNPGSIRIEHPFSGSKSPPRNLDIPKPRVLRVPNTAIPKSVIAPEDPLFNPKATLDTTNVRRGPVGERKKRIKHEYSDENALLHYGILGMRWGVRKNRKTGKRVGTPAKGTKAAKHSSPSVSPSTPKPSSSTSNLTTQQLRETVDRIRLENEFKKLTATPPTQKSRSRKLVEDILTNVGKRQAEHLLNSAIQSQVDKWLKSQGITPISSGKKKK